MPMPAVMVARATIDLILVVRANMTGLLGSEQLRS
jgi:hypothetical protein